MKASRILTIIMSLFLLSSCGVKLLAPSVTITKPLYGYKYFYVTATEEKTSTSGYVYDGIGSSKTRSVNPADIISGSLISKGFTKVPELKSENLDRTFIVNFGETGRRDVGLFASTIEVTLQFVAADSHDVLCISKAEGCGETEADDVRMAIQRALDAIFEE